MIRCGAGSALGAQSGENFHFVEFFGKLGAPAPDGKFMLSGGDSPRPAFV